MDPFRDKLAPTYDELPEVVPPRDTAAYYSGYGHGGSSSLHFDPRIREATGAAAAPIPAVYDTTEKEVLHYTDAAGTPVSPVTQQSNRRGSETAAAKTEHGVELSGGADDLETAADRFNGRGKQGLEKKKTVCGMAARTFWFVVVVAVVVVAAAVGGGVGGGIAAGQGKASDGSGGVVAAVDGSGSGSSASIVPPPSTSSSSSSSFFSSSSPSSTATSTPSSASSAAATPSAKGFSFQAFSEPEYLGLSTALIKVEGALALPWNSSSYVWHRGGTACCVTFCVRKGWVGWWCQDKTQDRASKAFDNIEIGCSSEESEAYSRAKCAS